MDYENTSGQVAVTSPESAGEPGTSWLNLYPRREWGGSEAAPSLGEDMP